MAIVTRMVMNPPKIIEGIRPSNEAAIPDSKAPNSLDELINMPLMALMRPMRCGGADSCKMDVRITMETVSNPPERNKQATHTQKL